MNIVITGASKGIGFETAKLLSKNHHVIAVSRDIKKLKKISSTQIFSCDISRKNEIHKLQKFIAEKFTCVDVLINNAGYLSKQPVGKISDEELLKTFETNFFSAIRLVQALLPLLKKSNKAHIVNIGSIGGFQGSKKFTGLSVYSSSKAALACFTECLADELKNISVNCLALGSVQTEMFSVAFPGYKASSTPKQIAEFIAHFSTTGHHFYNGKILPVSVSTP